MRIQSDPDLHLTYCLNIHPGEQLSDVISSIETYAVRVRDRVSPDSPFGLGIRLGGAAVAGMDSGALEGLKRLLERENMYVFTINGFPYGGFHGARVKENVYAPDWRTDERREYTERLVALLGELLPEGVEGSISTVPVSYASWMKSDSDAEAAVRQLIGAVHACVRLEQESGKRVTLALEPEPDCYVQTTDGLLSFFNNHILTEGVSLLAGSSGMSAGDSEAALRRYLGVCVDTCHAAVQYEDLLDAMAKLEMEGIAVAKVQVSSAIKAVVSDGSRADLRKFVDEVYFHQTRTRLADGRVVEYADLDDGLLDALEDGAEVRTHFHVPLWFEGQGALSGTAADIPDGFFELLKGGVTSHVEVETYTFDVLPQELRGMDVVESVVKELEWVRAKLA